MAAIHYPNPTTHIWNDLVVGGSAGSPKFFLLVEENKITNGFFKDTIANWDGTIARTAFDNAMRGSYVGDISTGNYAHQAFAWTPTYSLLTGFLYLKDNANSIADIYVYTSNSATRISSPTNYFRLRIDANQSGLSLGEWVPFYLLTDTSDWSAFTHFHVEVRNSGAGTVYVDDLRLYECSEVISLDCPQTLRLVWGRVSDADYTMFNGDSKSYLKGWRPSFSIGYDYCSRAQLIKNIDISENMFCFFVPQSDGLMGIYTRMMNDFSSEYFKDKFIGHTQNLELPSIFLQRYKNKQYGISFYTPTFA